ncbi:MAG: glutamate racemase [Chloroflexota bacterium]
MATAAAPIGIFDSGVGGLSIARELFSALPAEDLVYFADCAYCPYGTRDPEEISERCQFIAAMLDALGVKLIVAACNTACAIALPALRERFAIPIIGLEPAVKPAARLTQTGRIAVLATPRTIASERLDRLIREHAAGIWVERIAAPGLVELVEAGIVSGEEVLTTLRPLVEPPVARGADVIVLGCTHYPFLRAAIAHIAGPTVQIIDSGPAIARRVHDVLGERSLAAPPAHRGRLRILTSGDPAWVSTIAQQLLGEPCQVARVSG